jgi:hypothetical protein
VQADQLAAGCRRGRARRGERGERGARHATGVGYQAPRAGFGLGHGALGRRVADLGKARVGTTRRGRAQRSGRRDVAFW